MCMNKNTPPGPMEPTPPPLRRLALIGWPPGPKPIPMPPRPPAAHTHTHSLREVHTSLNTVHNECTRLLLGNCGAFSAGRKSSGGSDLSSYSKHTTDAWIWASETHTSCTRTDARAAHHFHVHLSVKQHLTVEHGCEREWRKTSSTLTAVHTNKWPV